MTNALVCIVALIAGIGLGAPALAQSGGIAPEVAIDTSEPAVNPPPSGGELTAQGSDGPTVAVTGEQQAQIRAAFAAVDTQPQADIDFDIGVGAVVPQSVALHPLPAAVVMLVPAYAGYLYFAAPDGRIAIVAPATVEIVLVL